MRYVEAPEDYDGSVPSVFLAGGITGCPDWQAVAAQVLTDHAVVVLNPRRANFPIDDPSSAAVQIGWEYRHLRKANLILFWFPDSGDVVQPIALFELGAHLGGSIAVGADPGYVRRSDVVYQLALARADLIVHGSLGDTVQAAIRAITG